MIYKGNFDIRYHMVLLLSRLGLEKKTIMQRNLKRGKMDKSTSYYSRKNMLLYWGGSVCLGSQISKFSETPQLLTLILYVDNMYQNMHFWYTVVA